MVMKVEMFSIFIDESDNYMAVIIGDKRIVEEELNDSLKQLTGRAVHMRELSKGVKLQAAYRFAKVASKLCKKYEVKLICAKKDKVFAWLLGLVRRYVEKGIRVPIIYVDIGIDFELKEIVQPFYFKYVTIQVSKALTQCVDVFSWINLRRRSISRIRFIWERLANQLWELGDVS